jgi:hypothetical protein
MLKPDSLSEVDVQPWDSFVTFSGPGGKHGRNVAAVRFFPAHTSSPVSWSATHNKYRCPLPSGDIADRTRRPGTLSGSRVTYVMGQRGD